MDGDRGNLVWRTTSRVLMLATVLAMLLPVVVASPPGQVSAQGVTVHTSAKFN